MSHFLRHPLVHNTTPPDEPVWRRKTGRHTWRWARRLDRILAELDEAVKQGCKNPRGASVSQIFFNNVANNLEIGTHLHLI
jgi:hypothetical protein